MPHDTMRRFADRPLGASLTVRQQYARKIESAKQKHAEAQSMLDKALIAVCDLERRRDALPTEVLDMPVDCFKDLL